MLRGIKSPNGGGFLRPHNWVDALHLAIFNLTVSNNNKYHDVATSIIPFVKRRWKDLQVGNITSLTNTQRDYAIFTAFRPKQKQLTRDQCST